MKQKAEAFRQHRFRSGEVCKRIDMRPNLRFPPRYPCGQREFDLLRSRWASTFAAMQLANGFAQPSSMLNRRMGARSAMRSQRPQRGQFLPENRKERALLREYAERSDGSLDDASTVNRDLSAS